MGLVSNLTWQNVQKVSLKTPKRQWCLQWRILSSPIIVILFWLKHSTYTPKTSGSLVTTPGCQLETHLTYVTFQK